MDFTRACTISAVGIVALAPALWARPQAAHKAEQVHAPSEIDTRLATLLDASSAQGNLMERTQGLTKVARDEMQEVFAQVEQLSYPSRTQVALDARRDLIARGAAVAPVVIAELKKCDLATWVGWSRAMYASDLLAEMALGHFPCAFRVAPKDVAENAKMVASWSALAERTKDVPKFWSGQRDLDPKTLASITEKTPLPFIAAETVMLPGMKIKATTTTGTITIGSDYGFRRSYEWEGAVRSAQLDPRGERWNGSLGIYFAGPGDHWESHNGITRGVLEEGCENFKTVEEALAWIEQQRKATPLAYRNDGLVVGWDKSPERTQLNVNVWQITIDGKAPKQLSGSSDDAVVITK